MKSFSNLSVGLGIESLYGFATEYPRDSPLSTSVIHASLPLLDIKPTIAYRFNEHVSIGIGADIFTFVSFLGEGQAERKFISPGGGIPIGNEVELNGTGTTAGLNVSVLYSPLVNRRGEPILNIGLIWRSQAVLTTNGVLLSNGAFVANASTSLRFPESYEGGIAWWPVRDDRHLWKLEVDLNYVRWQSIRNLDVTLSDGTAIRNPQHWNNALTIGVGTEYKWLKFPPAPAWELALRTGYFHSTQAIPDVNFDPAIIDADAHMISLGAGFLCNAPYYFTGCHKSKKVDTSWNRGVGIDLAYHVFLFATRSVRGNFNPAVDGRYESSIHAGAITFRVLF